VVLKFAIVLFTLDVGVRRIQLDREEWLRATEGLRRFIFLAWQARSVKLTTRRGFVGAAGQVRAGQTAQQ